MITGAQTNRTQLSARKKGKFENQIFKSFLQQDENDRCKVHIMNLENQN